jgi:pimeloyl-ACP methyl ester carboxylesterase
MTTFVLVPGFWLGGWAWQRVAARLRAAGHDVYPVTLTGLGERSHLAGPHVNLDTHINDVVNLMTFEDLHEVVLVGHSYAGSVVTPGVADRIPERISRLVFVDTAPLPDGIAQVDFYLPDMRSMYEERVATQGNGWGLPLSPWEEMDQGAMLDGLGEAERTLMRSRATDMPFGAATQPLRLSNPAREQLPRLAICCIFTSTQVREMAASGGPLFSELADPQFQFIDLPTGHWPMFSRPDELADLLKSEE